VNPQADKVTSIVTVAVRAVWGGRTIPYNACPSHPISRVKRSDFHYELPAHLIAQVPLPGRADSRLLLVPSGAAPLADHTVRELPDLLHAGDLLVFNDTKVIPARVFGHKPTGGRVEILIERVLDAACALAQIGASKAPKPGAKILLEAGGVAEVIERDGGFYRLQFELDAPLDAWLQRAGQLPLPPYIQRAPEATDRERYQTVFARTPGAVAAPTAGLHFDAELLDALAARGIASAHLTLHVGAGTFQPVRAQDLNDHVMHREWLHVGAEVIDAIHRTRAAGGRVVAVGTTVVRALESCLVDGRLQAYSGPTSIFITPGYRITSVDALVTNFHLPESTLLMLVSAFAGRERILSAYQHAIAREYRFFSYGDAMLVFAQEAEIV